MRVSFSLSGILTGLLSFAAMAAMVGSLYTLSAPWFWLGDLASHFRVYYFVVLAPLAPFFLWKKRRALGLSCLLFAVLHLCYLLPYWGLRADSGGENVPVLKVASINVLTSNTQHEKVLREIRRLDPDLIFVMEVSGDWEKKLEVLKDRWPYAMGQAQEDNFGVLFLSKIPWTEGELRFLAGGVRSVWARFRWQGQNLTLIGLHPLPPVGAEQTRLRDAELMRAAEQVASREEAVVVLGDLNTTPWAESFQRFLRRGSLRDAALGYGIRTTWRDDWGLLRVPIDHICVNSRVGVRHFEVGAETGSDHRPVFAELVLKKGRGN